MNVFNKWWQWLTIILLLYVFVAGFIVPLKPGITQVVPNRLQSGSIVNLNIECYNFNLSSGKSKPGVWLKMGNDHFLSASKTIVSSNNTLDCQFAIPKDLPGVDTFQIASIIVSNDQGTGILPGAIFVKEGGDALQGIITEQWKDQISIAENKTGFRFPFRNILVETIRNTFFHTAIWFAMIVLLICSVFHSIRFLHKPKWQDDIKSMSYTTVGIVFGLLGTATGSVWARYTWGAFWTSDVKLNMTAIALLIYLAYWVLRSSIQDPDRKARVSASYNIFAFVALIPLIFIVPRMTDSLHPGNGGNPAMGGEDLDHTLRMVFYPAIIAYTLLGLWISNLYYRVERLKWKEFEEA